MCPRRDSADHPVDAWTPEQLWEALSAPPGLSPARPAAMIMERLERFGADGAGVSAEIEVGHDGGVERWRLTFDSMWEDVHDFPLQDAAFMVRTNIEEWWDTRLGEPDPPWLTSERLD